jgi:hypothetical protein
LRKRKIKRERENKREISTIHSLSGLFIKISNFQTTKELNAKSTHKNITIEKGDGFKKTTK